MGEHGEGGGEGGVGQAGGHAFCRCVVHSVGEQSCHVGTAVDDPHGHEGSAFSYRNLLLVGREGHGCNGVSRAGCGQGQRVEVVLGLEGGDAGAEGGEILSQAMAEAGTERHVVCV